MRLFAFVIAIAVIVIGALFFVKKRGNAVKKTSSVKKKWLEKHGKWAMFVHRDKMRRTSLTGARRAVAPEKCKNVPVTTLPVDCTGNGSVSCPMDGNDTLGDCGPVMCQHTDDIRSYGQGKPGFTQCTTNLQALEAQYEKVSGGDNGTTEDMLVGSDGIWTVTGGGLAGDPTAIVADHLDFDITNVALTQYFVDQFYAICMAWSVPDAFLQEFQLGASFLSPMTPDPENGHFTPLSDVDATGNYRLFTWGAWCWVSPAFVASVDPESFATFSALQFSKDTGLDSHGRHVSDQAAAWVAIGGDSAKVAAVVALFPPKVA
jgi:hypothetical protein